MFASIIALSAIFNSSFQKELVILACREVEVKKTCSFSVEASGFGSKPFILYQRQTNGELTPRQTDRLDISGKKKMTLKFEEQGSVSLVFVLFDKDTPIAMDAAEVLVVPPKSQLGEQTELVFPSDDFEGPFPSVP